MVVVAQSAAHIGRQGKPRSPRSRASLDRGWEAKPGETGSPTLGWHTTAQRERNFRQLGLELGLGVRLGFRTTQLPMHRFQQPIVFVRDGLKRRIREQLLPLRTVRHWRRKDREAVVRKVGLRN